MKGSIIVFLCFVAGCITGSQVKIDFDFHWMSLIFLYVLMLQVGMGIGSNPEMKNLVKQIRAKDMLIPLGTVIGALVVSALIAVMILSLPLNQVLAINYGCGYYSLSSILLNQLMTPKVGLAIASEIGTIALLANVTRELAALVFAPWIYKKFGGYGLIGGAGVTSTDVCLPTIQKWAGKSYTAQAILHGVLIDLTTPLFISLFCEL